MNRESLIQLVKCRGAEQSNHIEEIVRPLTPQFGYWVGLTFTIPENYDIFIENIRDQYGNPCNYNHFILVKRDDGEYHIFYPSVLCRTVPEFDESRNWTGEYCSVNGTVVEFVQKFTNMNDAINALVGKKIRISAIRRVRTINGGWKALPTFDFVD